MECFEPEYELIKESVCCLELISSSLDSASLDFSYLKNLYSKVESQLQSASAAADDPLVLGSLNSLLQNFQVHKKLLKLLQNTCNQKDTSGAAAESRRDAERRNAIAAMRLSAPPAEMGGLDRVVGVLEAKAVLREACVFPLRYPHLFKGAVRPWRRILLFGPPGTGKTLLAKGLAQEVAANTFCVSSANLFSSWIGESEKLIRDLFEAARQAPQTSLIFIDETDSLCRQRTQTEDEHSRRVKTELLRQLEGMSSSEAKDEPLVLAATNCPWDIDPAFLRRFQRRIYVGLPNRTERKVILEGHFSDDPLSLSPQEWAALLDATEGFSGADLGHLGSAVAMLPIQELHTSNYWRVIADNRIVPCDRNSPGAFPESLDRLLRLSPETLSARPVEAKDFVAALLTTRRTVQRDLLQQYQDFDKAYH